LLDISDEVRELAIQNGLSRAQIMALEKLRSASYEEYQRVTANSKGSSSSVVGPERKESAQIDLKDLSDREIEDFAEKAVKRERLKEFNRHRVSPSLKGEPVIVSMNCLGIPEERVAALLKINRKTVKKSIFNSDYMRLLERSGWDRLRMNKTAN
jgi:hypothetical protein